MKREPGMFRRNQKLWKTFLMLFVYYLDILLDKFCAGRNASFIVAVLRFNIKIGSMNEKLGKMGQALCK